MLPGNAVNRIVCVLIGFLCACHLGRPAGPTTQYQVGQVVAPVAEPGLADALKSSIAAALADRAMLGNGTGEEVNIAVLAATTMPTGVGPSSQVHTARLQFSVQVGKHRSQFSAERSYTVIDTVQGATARAEAFLVLSQRLSKDAALWMASPQLETSAPVETESKAAGPAVPESPSTETSSNETPSIDSPSADQGSSP